MKKIDIASTAPRVTAGDPTDWNLPDLNLLKVFEAIYDEGGAGRAALRLGVTQSAVSAALGRLRVLYGDPLFTRTGRGLAPSLRGRELRPVIGEALDKCRQSLALARPGRAGVAGRSVTLGLSDDFEIALGRDIMDRLAVEAPGLRVIFRQAHSRMAADMLMAREADLVIASGGLSAAALQKALVGHGGYACLLDPASLRRGQKTLSVEEFVRREHVLVSSGGFIGVVDEVLHGMGLKRRVQASTTHFSALAFLLRGGAALATLPEHAARGLGRAAGLALLPCPVAMPGYAIELGGRADALRDPAASALRRCLLPLLEQYSWRALSV
ncbi:LysR family transcriptional regulator [Achromobacter sp. Marseille-Q0513]|uniref:LysR substrate-binding domain-containing protein n=1 Tax=Achromobacter sp. Marseille-Q0513 TaxID=2829161 RepID=UPI001B9772F5|nr:LysR substrate-binding domain-containing protein [Achromobacter sp. Marseille-Q0513]MBR8653510.1 LysR family transcriptional regulator [Achromobacter sp. Marseille-Q0513]